MTDTTIIRALPIGEIDTDVIRSEFESIIGVFNGLGTDLLVVDPVSDEESARRSVEELSRRNPDLLVIIPLRGLTAQAIEAAVLTSRTPCLICPTQGRFALPSSALAVGALRESRFRLSCYMLPLTTLISSKGSNVSREQPEPSQGYDKAASV